MKTNGVFNQFGEGQGFNSFGQSCMFSGNVSGDEFTDPDVLTLFEQIEDTLTLNQKNAYNSLILGLKEDASLRGNTSNWEETDALWIFCTVSRQAAYLNVRYPANPPVSDGVQPSFTQFSGIQGNGTSQYLNLNWNPSTDGEKFLQNDASVFTYCRTNGSGTPVAMGGLNASSQGIMFRLRTATNNIQGALNGTNVNIGASGTTTDCRGLNALVRVLSNAVKVNRDGVDLFTSTSNVVGIINIALYGLARNNNGAPDNFDGKLYSSLGTGSGNIDFSKLKERLDTFETEIAL